MAEFKKTDSRGYTHKLVVTEKNRDVVANTTTLHWEYTLTSGSNNGFSQYGIGWEVWIDGKRVASHALKTGEYTCLKGGNTLKFGSGDVTITHNEDGQRSVECYAELTDINGASYTPVEGTKPSGTMELTRINRGIVYIDEGAELVMHQCYVFEDGDWKHVVPYDEDGTDWEQYG